MTIVLKLALAAAALPLAALPAAAQDPHLDPTFGTIHLNSPYAPDPYVIDLTAGGELDASTALDPSCVGTIANAPDIRINYDAGSGVPLIISATSRVDTTLAVNAPDGQWYCNDDGPNGVNPSIRFNNPMSGRYEIYVGTFEVGGNAHPARLHISQVGSQ